MTDRVIPVLIIIGLLVLGFGVLTRQLIRLKKRREFFEDFADRFRRYLESGGTNEILYAELTERVTRMQREMGAYGIMAVYRPPFANYAFNNYPIVANLLPEYRRAAVSWRIQSHAEDYACAIRDALLRYSGFLGELECEIRQNLQNPVVWIRESVRAILATPIWLLTSVGIFGSATSSKIVGSRLMRVFAGLLALIAIAANVVQIFSGWDASVILIRRLLANF